MFCRNEQAACTATPASGTGVTDGAITLTSVRMGSPKIQGRDAEQMQLIRKELGSYLHSLDVPVGRQGTYPILFKLKETPLPEDKKTEWRQQEAYHIKVTDKGTLVSASSTKGFFYALQSLKQLIVRQGNRTTIAACELTDYPDLQIRGFMNDVGRNFLPVELIKIELQVMAMLKFNTYHFHLTDHHGWRLESKLYPELKDPKNFTRFPGKVYSQKEFKELVEFCRLRNIAIIPELDMPGHSCAFRAALKVDRMSDPKATEALVELITELGSLASVGDMPMIHIGTDEVRTAAERVNNATLNAYYKAVADTGRRAIHWSPGLCTPEYRGKTIEQMWIGVERASARPRKGGDYIDSQDTYINHNDPFECAALHYFRRPCPYKDANGLGFILCSWPDVRMTDPRNHFRQTAIFPAMAFASGSIWNNPHEALSTSYQQDPLLPYYGNIPDPTHPLYQGFVAYEKSVLEIRDRFFKDLEFPYVKQSHVQWRIIGPFPHGGDLEKKFPVEELLKGEPIKESYTVDGKAYKWREKPATGFTVLFKDFRGNPTIFNSEKKNHFKKNPKNSTYYALQYIYSPKAQNIPCWIGAQHWPSSDRRNGGPPSTPNEWHHSKAKFYVNGQSIDAPKWANKPMTGVEDPYIDENYFYREPTMVPFKLGWNQILIKSPCNANPRRWMFTFAPIQPTSKEFGIGIQEFPGLQFSTSPETLPQKTH
ncbi:MAG: family 20 glycosylhydrolase [Akkermansia sp.]